MWSLIDDLMHGLIYERNPARFRIDCEVDDLKGIKRSQIASFIRKHYVPENMFLVAFGPRFEEVRELARRYFDDLKNRPRPALDYDHSDNLPVLASVRSNEIERAGIGQFHFALGFPTESYMSKDAEALDVLARILAFRLRQRLREGNRVFDQGVYRANVYTSRSFLHGLIYTTFATVSGEFARKGEGIVLEEIQKLKEELVGDMELDAMVNYIDNSYLDAFKKIALTLSEMVIEAVCNGDEDLTYLHSFRQRLHKITRKKLRHVANKYFMENYARVLIKPA
jgi:predicted Zn-dependent peptidase